MATIAPDKTAKVCGDMTITRREIVKYAKLTGDHNPIHNGPDAIVHGGFILGKISAAIWWKFGGRIIARGINEFRFIKPIRPDEPFNIFIGDPVPILGRERIREQACTVKVTKYCDGHETIVATGEVIVILPT